MINPKHSTAYMLFNYKYDFSVPAMFFYTEGYLANVGVVSTGDRAQDRELMKEPVHTRDCIWEMAKFHADDVPVRLRDPQKAVEIYEIITMHLDAWAHALTYEHNMQLPPAEDFERLDAFAHSIYEIARRYKPSIAQKVTLATRLNSLSRKFGRGPETPQSNKPATRKIEHHRPRFERLDELLAHRQGVNTRGNRKHNPGQ